MVEINVLLLRSVSQGVVLNSSPPRQVSTPGERPSEHLRVMSRYSTHGESRLHFVWLLALDGKVRESEVVMRLNFVMGQQHPDSVAKF